VPGGTDYAPEWLKRVVARDAAGRGGGSARGARGRGGYRAGKGGRGGKGRGKGDGAGAGAKGARVCHNWQAGYCQNSNHCKFAHPPGDQDHRRNQSLEARAVNMAVKAVEAKVALALKRGRDGGEAEAPAPKRSKGGSSAESAPVTDLYSLLAHSACLATNTPTAQARSSSENGSEDDEPSRKRQRHTSNLERKVSVGSSTACMVTSLHNMSMVAWDSGSGTSASTERADFPWLDTSEAALRGRTMEGVGGLANPTGVGPMVITLHQPELGRTVLIVDPCAIYNEPGTTDSARYRIVSAVRMKDMGLTIALGNPSTIVCRRTGIVIPVEEQGGITLVRTINKDARNYKRNLALRAMIEKIKRGEASPIYINDRVTVTRLDVVDSLVGTTSLIGVNDSLKEIAEYNKQEIVHFRNETIAAQNDWQAGVGEAHCEPCAHCTVLVMNMKLITAEQRARLMHWRLAHCNPEVPIQLTRKRLCDGVDVLYRLCEDCAICDKAKFRTAPFPRIPPTLRIQIPFWVCYADAMGGQRSMGVKSYGGAIGNFIFADVCSGDTKSMLYSKKSQFPDLLERYLIGVLALQYVVRIVRLDGDAVNISARVEQICVDYGVVLQPMSAGTPQENGFAEKVVGDCTRIARALMLGAPHIKRNRWGAAYNYGDKVNAVLPKVSKHGKTPYEIIHLRVPDMNKMYLKVWGCPVQFKPLITSNVKMDERTIDGYFLGVDPPSVLVDRIGADGKYKLMRISPKKVRCHEGMYCKSTFVSMDRLRDLVTLEGEDNDDLIMPSSVPSIKVLKPGTLYDPLVNQGEKEVNSPQVYLEDNEEIDQVASKERVREMRQYYLDENSRPDIQEEILDLLGKRTDHSTSQEVGNMVDTNEHVSHKREREDSSQIDTGISTRARTRASESKIPRELEHTQETADQPGTGHTAVTDRTSLRPPISRAPVGSRVMIESTRFDGEKPGSYSESAEEFTYGTLVKRRLKGGMVEVEWDGDSRPVKSYWKHLSYSDENLLEECRGPSPTKRTISNSMVVSSAPGEVYERIARELALPPWHEPLHILALVERATVAEQEINESAEYDNMQVRNIIEDETPYPKSTLEALTRKRWRRWVEAIQKEHNGWVEANAFEIVDKCEMEEGAMCVDILEIFNIKRDGTFKFRSALRGDQLRKDIDYKTTFSGTVTADSIRFFFSLATQLSKQVHGGDVKCAYLQGRQRIPIYAYLPSYVDLVSLSWEDLAEVRRELCRVFEQGGKKAIRQITNRKRRDSRRVMRLLASVYGTPDAGNEWALLLAHILTHKMGFKRSCIDGCIYFKTNEVYVEKTNNKDSRWVTEYIMVIVWTDDMPYFGTDSMVEWYQRELPKHVPIVFTDICKDFIGIEIHQDLVRGVTELTQSNYWVGARERFKQYLTFPNRVRIPLPEGTIMQPPTQQEFEMAKHVPYPELIGCMAFASCHTKLEIRYAISVLSAFMRCWSLEHWHNALQCLKYCINTRDMGLMYSRGLDAHGVNVLYAFCDAAFTAARSQGCRSVLMNGGAISLSSQKHSTVDTSTTAAELTEAFLVSNDVMGFRNLLEEMGFQLEGPTVIYEDNQPAIAVAEGHRNLASKTKHMEIRVWKLRERIDDQDVILQFCSSAHMQCDLGTKALGASAFEYLRDLNNGYATVRLRYPDYAMSSLIMTHVDLVERMKKVAFR
jgi:hypothetical protein